MQRIPSTIPSESLDIFQILHVFVCESSSSAIACCRLTFLRAEQHTFFIRPPTRQEHGHQTGTDQTWPGKQLLATASSYLSTCRLLQKVPAILSGHVCGHALITTATIHFKDVKSDCHIEPNPPPDYKLCEMQMQRSDLI